MNTYLYNYDFLGRAVPVIVLEMQSLSEVPSTAKASTDPSGQISHLSPWKLGLQTHLPVTSSHFSPREPTLEHPHSNDIPNGIK